MKIAIVNVVGTEGSTGIIATKLANYYKIHGYECRVYYGRGQKQNDGIHRKYGSIIGSAIHYGMEKITDREGEFSPIYTKRLINDFSKFEPEIVILLNLHGHYLNIPMFMECLSNMNSKIMYFMCDEFPYTARCEYIPDDCEGFVHGCKNCPREYKFLDKQFETKSHYYEMLGDRIEFSSVGYITEKAKKSSLLKNKRITTINTGIDTDYYCPVDASELKIHHNIESDKIILINVAPFSNKRKGVDYFLEAARQLEQTNRFIFLNIGYDGPKDLELPGNYIGIPYIQDQNQLRQYYSLADAYICTSTADALPNACVSAMSCGTPIVGFPISGIPYLADEPVLHLLDEVGSESIVDYVKTLNKKTNSLSELCRKCAIDNYSFEVFAEKLLSSSMEK